MFPPFVDSEASQSFVGQAMAHGPGRSAVEERGSFMLSTHEEASVNTLTVVNGLPAHILFVHAVIVLVPLTAFLMVACAVWPGASRRAGVWLPLLALVTLVFVPVTTQAGEWLESHVPDSPLVERHAELGDSMLPWALGLFVLSVAQWWLTRRSVEEPGATARSAWASAMPVRVATAVVVAVVAVGAVVTVVRIGDSGARAAWQGQFSTPHRNDGD
jgi:hypothetical protein